MRRIPHMCLDRKGARLYFTAGQALVEVWEEKRIAATLRMVEIYESQLEYKQAEELLLALLAGIVALCKTRSEERLYEAKIKITLEYARFLKRRSRDKEAEKIIIEVWNEHKALLGKKDCDYGDGLLVQIRLVGEELKRWNIFSKAESVFTALWSFYKRNNRHTSSEGTLVAVLLASVLRSREEVSSEEDILKEIYRESLSRQTIDITVIRTYLELSAFYERQERWGDAIDVCTNSLVKVWPSLINFIDSSRAGICALPRHHHHEALRLAYRLAVCYLREGREHDAESVHLYTLTACRTSLRLQDETILVVAEDLVKFYQSIGKIERAIATYHELYEKYRGILGVRHPLTIKITYRLASFCSQHQPRDAEKYYLDIITDLSRVDEFGIESINAVLVLCEIYERDKKFKEALALYSKLWTTFCRHGKGCELTTEAVLDLYIKYISILEKLAPGQIYDVTIQFREACTAHYGKHHTLTIEAAIKLAELLEKDESTHQQAIAIYEEICNSVLEDITLRVTMQSVVFKARKRLAHLYSSQDSW